MTVRDNRSVSRFEMETSAGMAFIDYRRANGIVTMIHAEVPPALQGRGMGAELVRGALDLVSAGGETVIPRCSFVAAYIKRHREYHALLA